MGKQQGIQKKITRVLLGNPYPTSCPPVSDEVEKIILDHLSRVAQSCRDECKEKSSIRKELVFGLNAVTRSVERDSLCAALVARPVQPQILCQHLTAICAQKGVPLLSHSQLNGSVAKMFQISSLVTLGIKRSAESPTSVLHRLFNVIQRNAVKQNGNPTAKMDIETATFTFSMSKAMPPKGPDPTPVDIKTFGEQSFIYLNQHPVFPDPDYPRELDTLKMKINWSLADLKEKESPQVQKSTPDSQKKRFLLEPRIEEVTSSGKTKKNRKAKQKQQKNKSSS